MRLAVFADVHGNLPALEAVLADMEGSGDFDLIWCLGDLAAVGGQAHECVQRLRELRERRGEEKVKIIGGNTDRYLVTGERLPQAPPAEESAYAAYREGMLNISAVVEWNMRQLIWEDFDLLRGILDRELQVTVPGYGAVIGFHAIPGDDEAMSLLPDSAEEEAADALLDRAGWLALCGHTHLAMDRRVGGWRVINPGSVGLSAGHPGFAEWAWLEWKDGDLNVEFRRLPYDAAATLRQWEALGHPRIEWVRARLAV